jgi:hypothetical protein
MVPMQLFGSECRVIEAAEPGMRRAASSRRRRPSSQSLCCGSCGSLPNRATGPGRLHEPQAVPAPLDFATAPLDSRVQLDYWREVVCTAFVEYEMDVPRHFSADFLGQVTA